MAKRRSPRRVEPGSREEREKLLKAIGFDAARKAIMLKDALDAVDAGLSSPSMADRLRAASMALGVLGARPSRNPMAPPAPTAPTVEPEPSWLAAEGSSSATPRADVPVGGEGGPGVGEDEDDLPF